MGRLRKNGITTLNRNRKKKKPEFKKEFDNMKEVFASQSSLGSFLKDVTVLGNE